MLWNKDDLASLRLLLLRKSRQQLSSLTLIERNQIKILGWFPGKDSNLNRRSQSP